MLRHLTQALPGPNTQNLFNRGEFADGLVESQNAPIADVVNPSVEPDRPRCHASGHTWMRPQMLELQKDVLLNQRTGHVVA